METQTTSQSQIELHQQNLPCATSFDKGEMILYQPDNSLKLNVLMENETVWLSQMQMAELFQTTRNNVTLHISNLFREGELDKFEVCKDFLHTTQHGAIAGKTQVKSVKLYNLDVIISVGYRVKSQRGTCFRRWATSVLKDYLLKGYVIHERFQRLENRMIETEKKIDFLIQTDYEPKEGIFYDGQIFDAYVFASTLIKSAKKSIVLIDNYVDESTLLLLSKRSKNVQTTVYTSKITSQFELDLQRHNAQYSPVFVKIYNRSHDRFLFIDNTIYHIGASLKDLGKKLFAFSKMDLKRTDILK